MRADLRARADSTTSPSSIAPHPPRRRRATAAVGQRSRPRLRRAARAGLVRSARCSTPSPTTCRSSRGRRRRARRWRCAARRPRFRGCAPRRRARRPSTGALELDAPADAGVPSRVAARAGRRLDAARRRGTAPVEDDAGLGARLAAVAIDLVHPRSSSMPSSCTSPCRSAASPRPTRPAAQGPAARVPARAERRLPRGVHRRRPDAGQDGGRHQGRVRRAGRDARPRARARARAALVPAGGSGRPRASHRRVQPATIAACTIDSPARASSARRRRREPGPRPPDDQTIARPAPCSPCRSRPRSASATRRWRPARSARPPASSCGRSCRRPRWCRSPSSSCCSRRARWSGSVAERHFGRTDPGQVVIDEVMGMLITLFLNPGRLGGRARRLPAVPRRRRRSSRIPANRLERLHGGFGMMADDAMAAVYANLALRLSLACWFLDRSMKACIIAVGSEMLTPFRVDTNSLYDHRAAQRDRLRRAPEDRRRRRRRRTGAGLRVARSRGRTRSC